MPGSSPVLPRHRVPAESLVALAEGDGDHDVVDLLVSAERSRRLLLLRMLDEMTSGGMPGPSDGSLSLSEAWELLARAQRAKPAAVDAVLLYPQTGMWLSSALRRLRGTEDEATPLWVVLGHLSALAAAAGVRAGLDFTITVPVRYGYALLPTLGAAEVTADDPWTTVWVRSAAGETWITTPNGRVRVAPHPDRGRPGWHPLRWLRAGHGDSELALALDDLDPYRTYPRPTVPERLPDDRAERWQELLERTWTLLLRDEPQTATAMRRGLMSFSPVGAGERFRPRSASTGDAFGGVLVSEPDDAVQLAATMVHEFQHSKLSGLLHLTPLYRMDAPQSDERLYAPWRDDPRPLGGLLQGIYAFTGVTRFWRTHRHSAVGGASELGHFEFALWRSQLWSVLDSVRDHRRLTPLGHRFLGILRGRCAAWLDDPVPDVPGLLAHMCADNHRARWRAYHLRPAREWAESAARRWTEAADGPPESSDTGTRLAPDRSANRLDSLATLVRHRLEGTAACGGLLGADPAGAVAHVKGALEGDALLAAGEPGAARRSYVARLAAAPDDAAAWAGLGGALTAEGVEPDAARLLTRHPERARAVQRVLVADTGRPGDPVRLAAWLGGGLPTV
ncbi:HEXXH motif domain-containing protein [Streptomyces ferrugineus]|uniref:HEXXH motif domain-containing protein n=1 Tax=Streptomyces ferrugineus TaxID=1413221 RepID=A0A7M2SUC9_9ACTN|nr:HEXXH motif domain-containing protein [Streptomyces ferrugineus]QOV39957.1 HEXXH motif domain-containing protein [Streptomyces ferrugineus]